jgi:hypothetical protein
MKEGRKVTDGESFGSRQEEVTGSCEHNNKNFGSMKC